MEKPDFKRELTLREDQIIKQGNMMSGRQALFLLYELLEVDGENNDLHDFDDRHAAEWPAQGGLGEGQLHGVCDP